MKNSTVLGLGLAHIGASLFPPNEYTGVVLPSPAPWGMTIPDVIPHGGFVWKPVSLKRPTSVQSWQTP